MNYHHYIDYEYFNERWIKFNKLFGEFYEINDKFKPKKDSPFPYSEVVYHAVLKHEVLIIPKRIKEEMLKFSENQRVIFRI